MNITVTFDGERIRMPDATTVSIGNSGIVTLYNGNESTAFNFKRITTAEGMIIHCYNNTDYAVCRAFVKRL